MRRAGFTLLEMLVVVAVLATLAGVVVAGLVPGEDERRRELAAAEVAAALRFARSEAARTGEPHGARLTTTDSRIRVYRLDTSSTPFVEDFSVRHPLDKRLYDLVLPDQPLMDGIELSLSDFRFGGDPTPRASVTFEPDGRPVSALDRSALDQGEARVLLGGRERVVDVAPLTGRVSVP